MFAQLNHAGRNMKPGFTGRTLWSPSPIASPLHGEIPHEMDQGDIEELIAAVAVRVGLERVVLSGGCFQNRYLLECAVRCLEAGGFRPYWHQRIPPNDGGIATGQVFAALRGQRKDG